MIRQGRDITAAKAEVLGRLLLRDGQLRQERRDQGLEVPVAAPGSFEAYADRVWALHRARASKPGLRVLDGGSVEGPAVEPASLTPQGDKTRLASGELLGGLPTTSTEENV